MGKLSSRFIVAITETDFDFVASGFSVLTLVPPPPRTRPGPANGIKLDGGLETTPPWVGRASFEEGPADGLSTSTVGDLIVTVEDPIIDND